MAKKQHGAAHASESFAQLVGKAQSGALKPQVQQVVQEVLSPILQNIQRILQQDKEMLQIRQLATERLLQQFIPGFTSEALIEAIADVQDAGVGVVKVTDAIQQGDTVRFEVETFKDDKWLEPAKMAIQQVDIATNGNYQTVESLEKQLIGLTTGESRELDVIQGTETLKCRVNIKRISRKAA